MNNEVMPDAELPQPHRGFMKWLLPLVALVVLAAAAYVYFVTLPAHFTQTYKNATEKPFGQLQSAMNKSFDSFGRPAFASTTSTDANDTIDISYAQQSIKSAQAAADSFSPTAQHLTVLPGTKWRKQVKDAVNQRAYYENYTKKSQSFLAEYQVLVTYATKLNALNKQLDAASSSLNAIGTQTNPATIAASLNTSADNIDSFAKGLRAITPPAFLQSFHNASLADVDKVVASLRLLATGYTTLNQTQLATGATSLLQSLGDLQTQAAKFVDQLQNHSDLHSSINAIRGYTQVSSS